MEKAKKGTLFHILFHFMKKIAYWKMIPMPHKQSQEEEGKKVVWTISACHFYVPPLFSSWLASNRNGKELYLSFYFRAIYCACFMLTSLPPWSTYRHLRHTEIPFLQFIRTPRKAQTWCGSVHHCVGKDKVWTALSDVLRHSFKC